MRAFHKNLGLDVPRGSFTVANTSLQHGYPELGTVFKASTVKQILVFLTSKVVSVAEDAKTPTITMAAKQ